MRQGTTRGATPSTSPSRPICPSRRQLSRPHLLLIDSLMTGLPARPQLAHVNRACNAERANNKKTEAAGFAPLRIFGSGLGATWERFGDNQHEIQACSRPALRRIDIRCAGGAPPPLCQV